MSGCGSLKRGPTLKSAAPRGRPPPGVVAVAPPGCGARYELALVSHRPTPIPIRTTALPGFQAACGTRTSIWRRVRSVDMLGAGEIALPVAAYVSSAAARCTVTHRAAG